ncbi:NAD(P)-dependent oxidoreductase [Kitasatospora sp. NPDC004289]
MEKIAFLGLGRMGLPMAKRLKAVGYDVTVWNRTPGKGDGLDEAEGAPEAVRGAGTVVTMLADAPALREVAGRVAGELAPGTLWVEMSSVGPEAVAELRAELPDGVALVDAPVLGSVGPAASGGLTVLAGGRAADVERARPVLAALGTVVDCGGPGAGAALKVVVISAIVGGVALVGEALAVADGYGLPEELTARVLGMGPLAGLLARATTTEADFPVRLAAKDVALAAGGPVLTAVAEGLGSRPELADRDLARYVDALRAETVGRAVVSAG